MGYSRYEPGYLEQDLRRLRDAALDLLWRVNPAAIANYDWLPEVMPASAHRAAWELMRQLLLILIEVHDIETIPLTNNWSMVRGKIGKTGYPLRYAEHDLHGLQDALAELALRLDVKEYREIGPQVPDRRLRWLAEGLVARAEAIVAALMGHG
jgi:hypothetical protein